MRRLLPALALLAVVGCADSTTAPSNRSGAGTAGDRAATGSDGTPGGSTRGPASGPGTSGR